VAGTAPTSCVAWRSRDVGLDGNPLRAATIDDIAGNVRGCSRPLALPGDIGLSRACRPSQSRSAQQCSDGPREGGMQPTTPAASRRMPGMSRLFERTHLLHEQGNLCVAAIHGFHPGCDHFDIRRLLRIAIRLRVPPDTCRPGLVDLHNEAVVEMVQ
jgi:hypothetical protein